MAGKKSKNNPNNRSGGFNKFCGKCKDALKKIMFSHMGKNKMCTMCKCGVHDNHGKLVWTEK